MAKKKETPSHWDIIHFRDAGGKGLKGITKYDTAFLEEFDLLGIKNTDLQLASIKDFCQQYKVNYRIILVGKNLRDNKVIYDPKIIK